MSETSARPATATAGSTPWQPMPQIDLRQLRRLTDDTGMFQHALHLLPDPNHGYCIDDNARALIAALLHAQLHGYDEHVIPLQRYLGFVAYAFNPINGRFRNFMSYDRRWLEEAGSEDSHGRAMWSLGLCVELAPSPPVRELAEKLFRQGLAACREQLSYIRPWAFTLLGLDPFVRACPNDGEAAELRDELAQRLFSRFRQHASDDWPWWEDELTWGNARLPHALLIAGRSMEQPQMIEAGLKSLKWCLDVQTAPEGHLSIIGNHGWMVRGREKAQYDQQPLEAYAMVHACLAAAEITGDQAWANRAWRCFEWFRGQNDLSAWLYHEDTGGCQDGLTALGPNLNQGAESSLAYLLSVLELHRHQAGRRGQPRISVRPPRTLGLAVIGASGFANFTLEQYRRVEGLKPIGIWNRTTSKGQRFAEAHDIKSYASLPDLLADPQVHVVHVATTPDLHAQHSLAAIESGKHVLCEKPVAIKLAEAQRLIQTASARDRKLSVNFMKRYGMLAHAIHQLIESNILGSLLRGMYTNRAGDAGLPLDHWFWDESRSGGIFVEHAVHELDLFRYWLGEGNVLSAWRLRRPDTTIVDQVGCEVRYGKQTAVGFYHGFHQPSELDLQDARLVFELGQVSLQGWVVSDITIDAMFDEARIERLQAMFPTGTLQTVRRYDGQDRSIQHRGRTDQVDRYVEMRIQLEQNKQEIYGQALRDLMADFVKSIRTPGYRPRVTGEDGRVALEQALIADRLAKGVTP